MLKTLFSNKVILKFQNNLFLQYVFVYLFKTFQECQHNGDWNFSITEVWTLKGHPRSYKITFIPKNLALSFIDQFWKKYHANNIIKKFNYILLEDLLTLLQPCYDNFCPRFYIFFILASFLYCFFCLNS